MRLTDTHCYLEFNKFDEDRQAVIQRATDRGIARMLIPALDLDSARACIRLAEAYPSIFAPVGFHPTDLDKWNESSIDDLRVLIMESSSEPLELQEREPAPQNKILAIGEIGLDYYWVKESEKRAFQREILKQQL